MAKVYKEEERKNRTKKERERMVRKYESVIIGEYYV